MVSVTLSRGKDLAKKKREEGMRIVSIEEVEEEDYSVESDFDDFSADRALKGKGLSKAERQEWEDSREIGRWVGVRSEARKRFYKEQDENPSEQILRLREEYNGW